MVKPIEEPAYIKHRIELFERLYAKQQEETKHKPSVPIKITMLDGTVLEGESYRTSPYDIANSISQGLAQSSVIAKVNEDLWDMTRVLESDCSLEFLKFSDAVGKDTFWHSSAHFLGQALELVYGGDLAYGPPIADGFFYDMRMPEGMTVKEEECKQLEDMVNKMSKDKQVFERLVVSKADLLEMFKYNPFKQRIIREKVMTEYTTAYRCGPLIDLCRGPHIRNAGMIKGVSIHRPTSSHWEGKKDGEVLQRVYAISFPEKQMLKDWLTIQEEAAKRDHRRIGKEHDLFFFNEFSAGSAFFTPKGAHIYKELVSLQRNGYHARKFTEVITPNIFSTKLWKVSGHYQHYKENMFLMTGEKPTPVADDELKALNAALEATDADVVKEKANLKDTLAGLEAKMTGASPEMRATLEAKINRLKAHPPISLRKATHDREVAAAKVDEKTDALIKMASARMEIMNKDLVTANFALEEAVAHVTEMLDEAKLPPGDAFFARKEVLAADAELPADAQVLNHD